jgi:hypothetical protein
MVKLNVFDVLGNKVSEVVNSVQNAGTFEASFDAAGLASGVYFYRIDVTGNNGINFTDTKKLILVK